MKFAIVLCALLLPSAALAQGRTPGPLSTKETGRLGVAESHLEDCEDALARDQWTDSCDLARAQLRETSHLRAQAVAWCRAARTSSTRSEGVHPSCARFGDDALGQRLNRLDRVRRGSR